MDLKKEIEALEYEKTHFYRYDQIPPIHENKNPKNKNIELFNHSYFAYLTTNNPNCSVPSSGEKWMASLAIGFLFALISSPFAYYITGAGINRIGGRPIYEGVHPNYVGLLIHTIIFILIVRYLLL